MERDTGKLPQALQESSLRELFMSSASAALVDTPTPQAPAEEIAGESWPVIVHCHLRWDFVWQRPQQIFSRLAKHHRVLFIEDPMAGPGEPRLEISEPQDNIVRLVPILPAQLDTVESQCAVTGPMIKDALREHPLLAGEFGEAVQWFYSPMTARALLGDFGAPAVIYDCMDELANFRFAPSDISQRERWLLSRCDVVFTGGHKLFESKSNHHANVHFHGCGVDVAHFGKARLPETEMPEAVSRLPKPIFGYFGVIDERLDYPLIEALASENPDASIVMAGPLAKVEQHQLPDLPNIYWLGQQPYEALPALVKGFDVCLMPFALNASTQFINPTKTLEYMAAGKPIVSTAVPDVVRNFTPIVTIADSTGSFVEATREAWTTPNARLIDQGLRRADAASWDAVVSAMEHEVDLILAPVEKPEGDRARLALA